MAFGRDGLRVLSFAVASMVRCFRFSPMALVISSLRFDNLNLKLQATAADRKERCWKSGHHDVAIRCALASVVLVPSCAVAVGKLESGVDTPGRDDEKIEQR